MAKPDCVALVRARLEERGLADQADASLIDELAQHLEDRHRATRLRGGTEEAALAAALEELDGCERLAAEIHLRRRLALPPVTPGGPMAGRLAAVWQDLKYAFRALRRSPGFTTAAVLTVALSTGPTIAALGVANWLFVRPLPGITEPDRLALVWYGRWSENNTGFSPVSIAPEHLAEMLTQVPSLRGAAGQTSREINLTLDGTMPRVFEAEFVSASFFDVLGVRFAEGRGFLPDEDRLPRGEPVVVLSHALARSLFGAAPALDRRVTINGDPYTVIGVTPAQFEGTVAGQIPPLYLPGMTYARALHYKPDFSWGPGRGLFSEYLMRLAPGATFEQAEAELLRAATAMGERNTSDTEWYKTIRPSVFAGAGLTPFARRTVGAFTRLLLAVGALLIVLGAANLANLFIFRGARRSREAAVRRALGASMQRILQLHLIESLLVSLTGAALGVGIAAAVKFVVDGLALPSAGGAIAVAIDWRLLSAALLLAVVVGAVLAIAPARMASRPALQSALGTGSRGGARTTGRLRTGLAIVQLSISLTLLVGGLLFVATLRNIWHVDLGLDPSRIKTYNFAFTGQGYSMPRAVQFTASLVDLLRGAPGLEAVAVTSGTPLGGGSSGLRVLPPDIAARTLAEKASNAVQFNAGLRVLFNAITPDYFKAFGMRVLAGRSLEATDRSDGGRASAVVLSAGLAERLYGTTQAVGQLVTFPAQGGTPRFDAQVVGVVNDVRWRDPRQPVDLLIYLPMGDDAIRSTLLIRSAWSSPEVAVLVREAVARLDANMPVSSDRTLVAIMSRRLIEQRMYAWTLGVLAALGFVLAGIGIYGLVSEGVVERLREFGIRLAIGATPADIRRLVFRQALFIAAVGVPIGLVMAGLGSQVVKSQLFGITPLAPGVYAVAAAVLVLAVVAAVLPPARRAVRVNPVDVMRTE